MAYWLQPADRNVPLDQGGTGGKDWVFIEEPDGETRFLMARDAEPFLLTPDVLDCLYAKVQRGWALVAS